MDGGGVGKWEHYIPIVLNSFNRDVRISGEAKRMLNDYLSDLSSKIAKSCVVLVENCRKNTISSRDVQGAVRIVLPNDLVKYAVSSGTKAVMNISSNSGAKKGQKPIRRETRAKLIFPVSRAEAELREQTQDSDMRINYAAPAYLAAVLEYIAAEVLELSSHKALDADSQTISAANMRDAIMEDEAIHELFH